MALQLLSNYIKFRSPRYQFPYRFEFQYPRGWKKRVGEFGTSPDGWQLLALFMSFGPQRAHINLSFRTMVGESNIEAWLREWRSAVEADGHIQVVEASTSTYSDIGCAQMTTLSELAYRRWLVFSLPWRAEGESDLTLAVRLTCHGHAENRDILASTFDTILRSFAFRIVQPTR